MENNNFLTKDKVAVIIENAPKGITPEQIVNGLVARGYKLEGLNDQQPTNEQQIDNAPRSELTPQQKMERDTQNAASFIGGKELAQGIGQSIANAMGTQEDVAKAQEQSIGIQGQLLQQIKADKALGKDTSKLENALAQLNEHIAQSGQEVTTAGNVNNLTNKEVIGSALQLGANLIPVEKTASLIEKGATNLGAGKALANVTGKVLSGAGTGYVYDVATGLQNPNKTVGEAFKPGLGTAMGASLPVAGLLAKKLIIEPLSIISKNIASGLSGVSVNTLNDIINNPQKAEEISKILEVSGSDKVLENQVKEYMTGVSELRKEASTAFGKGLEQLSKTDIERKVFRSNIQKFLDNSGISLENGQRVFSNVEFSDPANIQKASNLVDKLSNAELDGKSLRKLVDDISSSAYKTATTDERLSYNIWVKDLASAVRGAITDSTDKLSEINKQYSKDIGLADAIQNIYGDVKFKNAEEINKIAKKIEKQNLTGLDEKTVNDFFNRIGESAQDFKTTSAVREISTKSLQRSPEGLSAAEAIRSITAGILTPKLVRDVAILVGKSEPVVKKILSASGSETAKKQLLNSLANLRKQ